MKNQEGEKFSRFFFNYYLYPTDRPKTKYIKMYKIYKNMK